ncbi:hypothetical protein AGMMS49587_01300 [Spirochaetia bacterium]|nr:hypothetical protein AGMMS49587_01300 [Spirochaetia bacterium]
MVPCENMNGIKKILPLLVLVLFCIAASCATSPAGTGPGPAPLWVSDRNAAFPDSQWLCVVESAKDKDTAQGAAMNALARVFRTDILGITVAYQEFTNVASQSGKKKIASFTEGRDFAQEVTTTSNITGLIGVQSEVWTGPDGTAYANARMNRRECAARYQALIKENEGVIRLLKEEAERDAATFDAFEALNFAVSVAEVTDYFQSLLEVLDPAKIGIRPDYGNADAVRRLAINAARSVVITVQVKGDTGGRITTALTAFLDSKGFRTNSSGGSFAGSPGSRSYLLSAVFELEDVVLGANQPNKFVRYVLNTSIVNNEGREVFSYSGNGREGHVTESEARQRAIRAAESAIGTEAFAKGFNAYLESLLK